MVYVGLPGPTSYLNWGVSVAAAGAPRNLGLEGIRRVVMPEPTESGFDSRQLHQLGKAHQRLPLLMAGPLLQECLDSWRNVVAGKEVTCNGCL